MVLLPGCACCGSCPPQPQIAAESNGYYMNPSKRLNLSVVKEGAYFGYGSHAFYGVRTSYTFPQTGAGVYSGAYDSALISNGRLRWVESGYSNCGSFNPVWSHDVMLQWQQSEQAYLRKITLIFPWATIVISHACSASPTQFAKSVYVATDAVTVNEVWNSPPTSASLSISCPGYSGSLSATYTAATGSSQVSEYGVFSGYQQTISVATSSLIFPLRFYGVIPVPSNKRCFVTGGGVAGNVAGYMTLVEVDFTILSVTGGDGFLYGENPLP